MGKRSKKAKFQWSADGEGLAEKVTRASRTEKRALGDELMTTVERLLELKAKHRALLPLSEDILEQFELAAAIKPGKKGARKRSRQRLVALLRDENHEELLAALGERKVPLGGDPFAGAPRTWFDRFMKNRSVALTEFLSEYPGTASAQRLRMLGNQAVKAPTGPAAEEFLELLRDTLAAVSDEAENT